MSDLDTILFRAEKLRTDRQAIDAELADLDIAIRVLKSLKPVQGEIPTSKPQARSVAPSGRVTKKEQILHAVEKLLGIHGSMHTMDIAESLVSQGIQLVEGDLKKSAAQLSPYLSDEKDRFTANRRIGWSLNKKPDNAPTLPGIPHG